MSDIHFINGEKGGVGKSFVCRAMTAYHLARQSDCAIYDADRTSADVLRTYGELAGVKRAVFSEGEEFDTAANAIFNTALSGQRVLVNLPAQVMPALSMWLEENEVFEMAADGGVAFYNWFVSDSELDSLMLFEQSLDRFEDNMRHVFVANYGKTKKWDLLTKNKPLMERMRRMDVTVVKFPKFLGSDDCKLINKLSLPFEAVATHEAFDAFGRQHAKSFLKKAFDAFDASEVFVDE